MLFRDPTCQNENQTKAASEGQVQPFLLCDFRIRREGRKINESEAGCNIGTEVCIRKYYNACVKRPKISRSRREGRKTWNKKCCLLMSLDFAAFLCSFHDIFFPKNLANSSHYIWAKNALVRTFPSANEDILLRCKCHIRDASCLRGRWSLT